LLFVPDCHSDSCLEAVVIDEQYFKKSEKEKRVLFFLGDYALYTALMRLHLAKHWLHRCQKHQVS